MRTPHTRRPAEIPPEPHHWQLLPAAQFADSYRTALPPSLAQLDAAAIAAHMMTGSPAWVTALLDLRNRLVAPLGLKGARLQVGAGQTDGGSPGFPVIAQIPAQVIMGIDDSHLDFRLCVEKSGGGGPINPDTADDTNGRSAIGGDTGSDAAGSPQWLTVTTVVHTKRRLGKAYLAAIMPFHRLIVRTLLERVAR